MAEGPETVGPFIAEPVLGTGGLIPLPEGYWDEIQKVVKRHDALLIADEVICGFGRKDWDYATSPVPPEEARAIIGAADERGGGPATVGSCVRHNAARDRRFIGWRAYFVNQLRVGIHKGTYRPSE